MKKETVDKIINRYEKNVEAVFDENEKMRLTVRECGADLNLKNKHGRESKA